MTAHSIPLDQLEAHTLVVGTTGSGKTYMLRGLLEQLRRADRRVGAIDKMGNLWGVTNSADGQAAGLEFVIFGGKRAHVPMSPADGAKLGRLFAERGFPAIFDVSQWKRDDQERWVADFADALFATSQLSTHLLLDEAQSWVPQGGGGEAFAAVQRLAEQGRGNGIHLLIAVQRMARLDSTVRGMMTGLTIAMKQTIVLDRKAVRDHVAGDAATLYEALPGLPPGTGFICDPSAASIERARFPRNTTFDSSRTPRHGDTPPTPIAVSSALVDELRQALAPPMLATPLPDDTIPAEPSAARSKGAAVATMIIERDDRIATLEAENAEQLARISTLERVRDHYARLLNRIEKIVREDINKIIAARVDAAVPSRPDDFGTVQDSRHKGPRTGPGSRDGETRDANASVTGVTAGETATSLPPRHMRILEAIGWANAYLKQPSVPRAIVAWMADVSPKASGFQNDLGALRTNGLISYPTGGEVALTNAGRVSCPPPRRPRDREALWNAIGAKLAPRHMRILSALKTIILLDRSALADVITVSAKASGFQNDLGHLRSLGLLEYPSAGVVQLAEMLR